MQHFLTFEQYVEQHHAGQTHAQIAEALGVSRSFVTQIINRIREPGRKSQLQIWQATGGLVTPDSWLHRNNDRAEEPAVIEP